MSQVFSGDSVNLAGTPTIPTTGEFVAVTGNFVNPPFQNAKAIVFGSLLVSFGASVTSAALRIRRNPNAENLQIGATLNVTAAAGNFVMFPVQAADVIPDGRPCQYAITVQQTGASATGQVFAANVSTILISG